MIWSIQLALFALVSLSLFAVFRIYTLYRKDSIEAPTSVKTKESDALTDYVKDLIG